jgi:hypothetical protein
MKQARRYFQPLLTLFFTLAFPILGQDLKIFFGNLHSHTAYSDGTGTPAQAYEYARTMGKLDFLAISEHNHKSAEGTGDDPLHLHIALDHKLYEGAVQNSLIVTAGKVNQQFPGKFVALYGQEFSSIAGGNHVNVFDVGHVIDEALVPNKNFRKLYDGWLLTNLDSMGNPALVQFNHPAKVTEDYGMLSYGGNVPAFVEAVTPHARTIAILSGPHDTKPGDPLARDTSFATEAYFFYLNLGLHLAPTADQDNHFITFGTSTDHRTAILAPALTKEDLLRAIRDCHVYATQDKNLQVDFRLNGKVMGSTVFAHPGDPITITVGLADPDEPNADYHVSLRHDTVGGDVEAKNEVEAGDRHGNGTVTFDGLKYTGGIEYYLVQVVQKGTGAPDQAWTAPIWITVPDTNTDHNPTGGGTPGAATAGFVWSRNSHVYHLQGCKDADRIADANKMTGNSPPDGKTLHANCPR